MGVKVRGRSHGGYEGEGRSGMVRGMVKERDGGREN